jgi:two-component sensor histidine kinase/ABC-type amino acid transport substrate-binding protein
VIAWIKWRNILAALGFCLCVTSYPGAAEAEPPLRVLTDDTYPPYVFRNDDNALQGIIVDQWSAWERMTGRKVELIGVPWSEAQRRMLAGEGDVIDTIFDTPERRIHYDFGPPYATLESVVFLHRTITGIASISDLKGFRVAVKAGDACIDVLKADGVRDLAEYPDYEAIVRAASKNEVRIFCVDRPPALYYLYKYGIDSRFRSSFSVIRGEFHRAVAKGKEDLLRAIDEGFKAIPKSDYAAIDRKWTGTALSRRIDLRIAAAAVAIASCIILFLFVVYLILRRRVAASTAELRVRLEELEASQAKNRAFIAALPDLFFTMDREGRYLEYSASSDKLLSAPPEDFLGRRVTEIGFPPELSERFLDCIGKALSEKRLIVIEYDLQVPAGRISFEGRFVPLDSERIILVVRDISDARRREDLLNASLAEKEVLLREVHHRVKNNLQLISSIVSLQSSLSKDAAEREFGRDTQARVRSIAQLHELLYGSDNLGSINPADYLKALSTEIAGSYGIARPLVEADPDALPIDDAVPFGLIANELITNAIKYSRPADMPGKIVVSYTVAPGGDRRLEVRDEGVGLPPEVDPAKADSLGFTLVRALTTQIDGSISFEEVEPGAPLPGLRVIINFPSAHPRSTP